MQVQYEFAERAQAVFGDLEQYGPARVQREAGEGEQWCIRDAVYMNVAMPYDSESGANLVNNPPTSGWGDEDEDDGATDVRDFLHGDAQDHVGEECEDEKAAGVPQSSKAWRKDATNTSSETNEHSDYPTGMSNDDTGVAQLRQMAMKEGYDPVTRLHASRKFCTGLEREAEEDMNDVLAAGAGPSSERTPLARVRDVYNARTSTRNNTSVLPDNDGAIDHQLQRIERNLMSSYATEETCNTCR